ncbi:hypothetical protein [Endozoicomonas ascidiicola]|uniref:hypothetical protein n=1 Tax=Endozoicomonas ascidiicola TaxID=1698521 RepID=UPI000AFEEAF8|nr:hypothetical protein [Endozoicomonas ascidiicola]
MGNHQKKRIAAQFHNAQYEKRKRWKQSGLKRLLDWLQLRVMHNFTDSTLYIRNAV